jgi:drug/metabolite transporter (DMT)-like permease
MAIGPVATILQAWWWLDEALTPLQLLGTGLVIAGVWLIGKKQAGKK